jgi:hypothetical protein
MSALPSTSSSSSLSINELKDHIEVNSKQIAKSNPNFVDGEKKADIVVTDLSLSLDDTEAGRRTVKITTNDTPSRTYILTVKQVRMCDIFAAALDKDSEADEIPCPMDNKKVLFGYVAEYLQHYDGAKQTLLKRPFKSDDFKVCANNPYDAEFADKVWVNKDIYDLIMFCNYLGISEIVHLICGKLAFMLKGKTEEEIKDLILFQAEHATVLPQTPEEEKKDGSPKNKERDSKYYCGVAPANLTAASAIDFLFAGIVKYRIENNTKSNDKVTQLGVMMNLTISWMENEENVKKGLHVFFDIATEEGIKNMDLLKSKVRNLLHSEKEKEEIKE